MDGKLSVSSNQNLLGPIYLAIHPKLYAYCGMEYSDFKIRFKAIRGRYRGVRRIYDLMHQISKNDFANNSLDLLDESYSPYVYYFELVESSNLDLVVYKCDFPRIYPNEDVRIIDIKYFYF